MFYYHKGLTRAARRTVATAITIAGRQGCTAVDTGHLLLAMLQTGRGTAVEFLRRKQITVTALSACASQRACTGRPLHLRGRDLAPESRKALEFAVLGARSSTRRAGMPPAFRPAGFAQQPPHEQYPRQPPQ